MGGEVMTTYVLDAGAWVNASYPLTSTTGEALLNFTLRYPMPP
jgi:hypothetical protein